MPQVIVNPVGPTVTVMSGNAPTPPATPATFGAVVLAGDLGGTADAPQVISTHLTNPLPVAQGGTGSGTQTFVTLGGDVGGTVTAPQVTGTHLSSPLPIAQGGTGSAVQTWVDVASAQSIGGAKTLTSPWTLASGSTTPALAGGSGTPEKSFDVNVSSGGRPLFLKTTSTYDHAFTTFLTGGQTGTGGGGGYNPTQGNNSSINAVSENYNNSAMFLSGVETGRGTLKIAHKGYADGSDANAAGLSIDLQTDYNTPGDPTQPGGLTGTAAQGIFVTSTTDSIPGGNALTIRYASKDWFVIKGNVGAGNGIVGIGVATGHTPAGMLEISQKDTSTIGLAMTAVSGGTDMINLKDSGGSQRFQINNSGNAVFRANTLHTANVILGSTSSDFGGAGSALTICHSTDPTTNPASGHVIIYVDAAGNLLARTSAGNVRTIAAV